MVSDIILLNPAFSLSSSTHIPAPQTQKGLIATDLQLLLFWSDGRLECLPITITQQTLDDLLIIFVKQSQYNVQLVSKTKGKCHQATTVIAMIRLHVPAGQGGKRE